MPDEKQAPYSLAHKARQPKNESKIVIDPADQVDQPAQKQPYTGTDPRKILKSDTQHIDKNVFDPNAPDYRMRPGAPKRETQI